MISPTDLDTLEEKARACPDAGPWEICAKYKQVWNTKTFSYISTEDDGDGVADFIAAASPSVILPLISEVRAGREKVRVAVEALETIEINTRNDSTGSCAKCDDYSIVRCHECGMTNKTARECLARLKENEK